MCPFFKSTMILCKFFKISKFSLFKKKSFAKYVSMQRAWRWCRAGGLYVSFLRRVLRSKFQKFSTTRISSAACSRSNDRFTSKWAQIVRRSSMPVLGQTNSCFHKEGPNREGFRVRAINSASADLCLSFLCPFQEFKFIRKCSHFSSIHFHLSQQTSQKTAVNIMIQKNYIHPIHPN